MAPTTITTVNMRTFQHRSTAEQLLTRISASLPPSDWHEYALETLWAQEKDSGTYALRNIPFYAFGLSLDDVVSARAIGNQLIIQDVVARGGHSTYRAYLSKDVALPGVRFLKVWSPLEQIGASYEVADGRLIAIDIPAQADIYAAYKFLEEGETAGVWDFQEGHCGHALHG